MFYHMISSFNNIVEIPFENIVGKRENAENHPFSPFPTMFCTLPRTNFKFLFAFIFFCQQMF